ncbi:MAG TPA: T9SS type A sorting domain-containing protein [Flavobacteriaceae bacterium]|nr:T9SS type A sorting domain-containing protein [Flavobacteriaceae bacterium]
MKKTILFSLCLCFSLSLFAQVEDLSQPQSWFITKNLNTVEPITLEAVNVQQALSEDEAVEGKSGTPYRFGLEIPVSYNTANSGVWDVLANGDRIWRLNLVSEGATTLNFIFDKYNLPEGSSLHFYSDDAIDVVGPYDSTFNRNDSTFGSWLVSGDNVWIEYYEPKASQGEGELSIATVVHGYRSLPKTEINTRNVNCYHDVECPIGEDLESIKNVVKHSVARIIAVNYFCTGALINNVKNDRTPYFLTAKHCDPNNSPAQWVFRFNWISEEPSCGTAVPSGDGGFNQVNGADRMSSNWNSDFLLMMLTGTINPNWDLVYAGWNRSSTQIPQYGMGIHHPGGEIMKVSRTYVPLAKQNVNVGDIPVPVQSWMTNWGLGVTAGGSSGSPLFDPQGRIVGQLSGGSSACAGTSGNGQPDFYGRMDVNFDFGEYPAERLTEWLDPDGTGAQTTETINLSTDNFQPISNITVYPNPASEVLYLMNNNSTQLQLEIFDVQGKRVLFSEVPNVNSEINVSTLNEGIYFLKLYDGASNSGTTKKIIIKN